MRQKIINIIKSILSWIKKHGILLLTILVIILSVIGPLIVKLIINNNTIISLFSKTWKASDALNYYSVIVAAIVGVIGIYITVLHSNQKYRDDIRNQTLPFFAFHILMRDIKYPDNWFISIPLQENKYKKTDEWLYSEYKLRSIYFSINADDIRCTGKLKDEEMELIKKDGYHVKIDNNGANLLFRENYLLLPYEIENVGRGPAINTRIGLNKSSTPKAKREYIKPESIKVGDSFSIHVFCNEINENITGKYILEVYYSDIYNNDYCQAYEIKIEKNKGNLKGYLTTTNYKTIQKRIQ